MSETTEITNSEDIIDSRDIIARIEYLESEKESMLEDVPESEYGNRENEKWVAWEDSDEFQELRVLSELQDQCNYGDWEYGETLIRDSYFEEYAQELAEDIGAINKDATWPNNCIDWEKAARELQYDYSLVSFDGVDYWIRAQIVVLCLPCKA